MPPDSSSFAYLNLPPNTPVPPWMGSFTLTARAGTDLWRKPSRDTFTAPVLYTRPLMTFTRAEVLVVAPWNYEWDQGGLVIFAGHKWVKAGIEFYDCRSVASSVSASTDGADWSLIELPKGQNDLRVRLEKVGTSLEVWFEDGGGEWKKLREVNWFFWGVEEKSIKVGVYASRPANLNYPQAMSSPSARGGDGLVVEFEGLEIW